MDKYTQPLHSNSFPLHLRTFQLFQPYTFMFLDDPGFLHLSESSKCPLSNKWQGPTWPLCSRPPLYLYSLFKPPPSSNVIKYHHAPNSQSIIQAQHTLPSSTPTHSNPSLEKPSLTSALPLWACPIFLIQSQCPTGPHLEAPSLNTIPAWWHTLFPA